MEQIYQDIGKTKNESSQAKEFKVIHITMWGTSKGCYWSRNIQELKILFRLGLILDFYICCILTIWKTLISPKGVEKKAISREMELLRLTFTSFAISSCTAAASIFSPWVLRTLCQKKGRPLRSLRHTRRARVLFVLVHFLWHVFKNVHFFISIFNAQGKEKKIENENV